MRTRAIINPHSSGKKTGARWPEIEKKLVAAIGPIETAFTDAPMAAARLTAQALNEGVEQIVAVGGDGTISEVVNGFFDDDKLINDEAVLCILTSGTGGDFRKTFDIPVEIDQQIDHIAKGDVRMIDIGKLTHVSISGEETIRYFNNIASFGLSGLADRKVNELTFAKKFGGTFAFQWGIAKAFFLYKNQWVRIQVDDHFDEVVSVSTAAVCNGQYFGSGMHMAPDAKPDDGLFDVVIIGGVSKLRGLRETSLLYEGKHIGLDNVTVVQGSRIVATPVDDDAEVLLDVDGEAPGALPATFDLLPKILKLRV